MRDTSSSQEYCCQVGLFFFVDGLNSSKQQASYSSVQLKQVDVLLDQTLKTQEQVASTYSLCISCSVMSDSLRPHGLYLPGSSVYGILQARITEWVAPPFSRRSPRLKDLIQESALQVDSLPSVPSGKCIFLGFLSLFFCPVQNRAYTCHQSMKRNANTHMLKVNWYLQVI